MATPQERLTAAIKFFFEQALPQASGKAFGALPDPLVHLGAYTAYTGQPVATSVGQSLTPKFVLRVMPALAASGGLPQAPAEVPATGGTERHLVWLRQAADVKVDTDEEIRRVMADVESFAPILQADLADQPADGAAPASPPAAGATSSAALHASDWARGLVAARASLPDDLNTLTAVPEPLQAVAADAEALRTVLRHFFTYDANGKYYPRWADAGRDGTNPAHLRPEYKTDNVREVQLERECLYLYAVVPESLLAPGGGIDQTAFREIVIRFDETGVESPPFSLATVHTARWRRTTAPHCDFVFVYTQDGTGITQIRPSRQKMSGALQALLALLDDAGSTRDEILTAMSYTHKDGDVWYVSLTVRLEGTPPALPAGVLADPELREWNAMQAPLDKLAELAGLPQVTFLGVTAPAKKSLDLARPEVNFAGLEAKIAAGKRSGKGVLVGIIDTGIDGSHPAFGTRIHAVWDQDPPASVTGKSPKDANATNDKYKKMNFGVELTKTTTPQNVTNSVDADGHGTHVAGITAGAEVKDAAGKVLVPAGLAPEATIVAVRAIGTPNVSDYSLGVDWIFLKAKELGLPCVINMSFGSHEHGHDGSDTDARKIFEQLTDSAKKYQPGRIVVAAAGNERTDAIHTRRSMPKAGAGSYKKLSTLSLGSLIPATDPVRFERVEIWIRNPTNTCPPSFPVGLVVYRQKTATTFDVTQKVTLGESKVAGSFAALNTKITISSQAGEHINGDYQFQVSFSRIDVTKSMTRADWSIAMDNQVAHPLDVHLWITRGASVFKDVTAADRKFLVGAPADGVAAISIAASVSKTSWTDSGGTGRSVTGETLHDIASFSSPGPLRAASIPMKNVHGVTHEVNAIDVTAPGCLTLAAFSSQWVLLPHEQPLQANARGIHLQGTSMASPLVAGLVANILAEETALTMPDVLDRLKKSASVPPASKFQPPAAGAAVKPYSDDWGYGLVDASKLKP